MIVSKLEKNTRHQTERNYYNNDWCDYYLYRENDKSYTLHPGKNTVYTVNKDNKIYDPAKESQQFICQRGKPIDKYDTSKVYSLPVKNGNQTLYCIAGNSENKRMTRFNIGQGDTVYATRGGIVCTTSNPRIIFIYHNDNTFAAYLGLRSCLIKPGDKITVGQPVGISELETIDMCFFFLDSNKIKKLRLNGKNPYNTFIPAFRTTEGDVRLIDGKTYQAVTDDELIMQDMTKK